jgi:hypothetical protein
VLVLPLFAQLLALTGKAPTRRPASRNPIQAKMPEVPAQFAPGRQQIDLDIIDDRERPHGPLGLASLLIRIGDTQLFLIPNRAPQEPQVDRGRRARARSARPLCR